MTWKEKGRRESKRWISIFFHGDDTCARSEREYDDQLKEKIQTEKEEEEDEEKK